MTSHADILPLHGRQEGAMRVAFRTFAWSIVRRLSLYRTVLGILSAVALYLLICSISSTSQEQETSGHLPMHVQVASKAKNPSSDIFPKSSESAAMMTDQERVLIEWESRADYRTTAVEVGEGRVSAYPAELFHQRTGQQHQHEQHLHQQQLSPHPPHLHPPSQDQFHPKAGPQLLPITAVILSWKRREGVRAAVAHLRKYPFIQEILIWNNNPEVVMKVTDFALELVDQRNISQRFSSRGSRRKEDEDASGPPISIFNAVANLHDFSKYTTCTLAKYDHCYLQDDDWINLSMDSMYTAFIHQPNTLLTSTTPTMYAQQRTWMYHNPQMDLHTGFTWLGSGSFVPKKDVFKFLQQLGGSNLWKERIQLSDLFFSLWRNQYPTVLSHALVPLDQSSSWSGRIDQWSVIYEHLTDAMNRLTTVLTGEGEVHGSPHRSDAISDFTLEEERPLFADRHIRSSCGNDRCLFQTNVDMFPAPDKVKWPREARLRDIEAHEEGFRQLGFPSPKDIAQHTYHYAVDQDPSTCWQSFHRLERGDFFGLQFVRPLWELEVGLVDRATVTTSGPSDAIVLYSTLATTLQALQTKMILKASQDGIGWVNCKVKSVVGRGAVRLSELRCLDGSTGRTLPDLGEIQYLRFEWIEAVDTPIEICGIHVGSMLL